ncbi:MAG: DNA topoisomerase I [Nanoarchaeota archaeon]|nr:DNA topoisomerase I [Nanoarchaeota archaeon]
MTVTLMISEKPDAAQKIASALGETGTISEHKINKTRYYTFTRNNQSYVVVPAVGHLFSLKHLNGKKWTYPIFDNEWIPIFEADKSAGYSKQYYKNFEKFSKEAKDVIVCTDWDNEGSVIAYNILRFIIKRQNAERMFFTTLTKEELNESFENRKKSVDKGMVNAGLARHMLDWMYGINITRALTISLKKARGGFYLLSTGRVQGPTLKILVEKEEEINSFKPEDYWQLSIVWNKDYTALYEENRIFKKGLMEEVSKACSKEKKGIVKDLKISKVQVPPPVPFNLTALQTEAYKHFKYNPYITQNIAQKLYTNALISYPRTSSQKLPVKIKFRQIIEKLGKQSYYTRLSRKLLDKKDLKPVEGKKDDQAHTAIYPTGEAPKSLSVQEKNVYDLIVRRFLSVFAEPGLKENKKLIIDVKGYNFVSNGSTILEKGWMDYYGKYALDREVLLPEIKTGEVVEINNFINEKKQTQPPNRYTQAGIVSEMEKRSIGTKATRASIIKTLNDRGYIFGESINVTKLGIGVTKTLEKHCPRIVSEELTRKFEQQMDLIENDKETKEEVISQAQDILIDISNVFKDHEKDIGEELSSALEETWKEQSNVGTKVGKCRNCGADLVIMYSKKNGQEFIGCSDYPKCNTTYALPAGVYEFANETCQSCGAPIVLIGKYKFKACIDKNCPSRDAGNCPECNNSMRLMFSGRGSRFIGCSNFPKCRKLFGLPSKGEIVLTNKKCSKCKSPIILLNKQELCLNKECK